MRTLLVILPYLGLAVSTLSAIWGLTHELYTKDENHKRHLTKAGRYSIAFVLLGLFFSLNTGVLKIVTDNQDKATARAEAAQRDQQNALQELARQQREEALEQRRRDEAQKQEAEIARSNQLQRDNALAEQQRDLALAQKLRDDALAQQQRDLAQFQKQQEGFDNVERSARERDRERAKEEFTRTQTTLFEIRRGLYPIKDITADASAEVPITSAELKDYFNRLNKNRGELAAEEGGWDKTSHVTLPLTLHPNQHRDKLAWRLLVDFGIQFEIFKTPINPSAYHNNKTRPTPDLLIKTRPIDYDKVMLEIEEDPNVVRVRNWNLRSSDRYDLISHSGKITSVIDLYGSQVFVTFRIDDGPDDVGNIYDIIQTGKLGSYLTLQIGAARITLRPLRECGSRWGRLYVVTLNDKSMFSGIDLTSAPDLSAKTKR